MNREIGSEFWEIPICESDNMLFPGTTKWFVSGRSALQAIIAENDFKSVGLPFWCCDSIIKPFYDSGIDVQFYDKEFPCTDAVIMMDFFGFTNQSSRKEFGGIIIRDITHSMFTDVPRDADYYFGSLRKWAGFWTGGFAWGFKKQVIFDKELFKYEQYRKEAMQQKKYYLETLKKARGKSDYKPFLQIFARAEEMLETVGISPAASRDIKMAKKIDITTIKNQRKKNAKVLLDAFSDIALFPNLSESDCPMFVPICVPYRNELRDYLIQKRIYCPVHWPLSEYHQISDKQRTIYETELSLVCDQRYDEDDMEYIVSEIRAFQKVRMKDADNL